jgi:AcrR family transcriptional regulator
MAREPKVDGRRARSDRTRTRIVEAAARLFIARGYLATTIEDIADQAGVAVQTVYYVFGTKRKLLEAVLDFSIAGDVEPVVTLERPWVAELRVEPDPAAAIGRLVEATVAIVARAAPIYEVLRQAAADPEVNALLDDNRRRRRHDQRQLVEILSDSGHLHPDVSVDTAADMFYALMNEEVFQLLIRDCQWDVDRFQRWVASVLLSQLIWADIVPATKRARRQRSTASPSCGTRGRRPGDGG